MKLQRQPQRTKLPTKSQVLKIRQLNRLFNTTKRDSVARKLLLILHQAGAPKIDTQEFQDWLCENDVMD